MEAVNPSFLLRLLSKSRKIHANMRRNESRLTEAFAGQWRACWGIIRGGTSLGGRRTGRTVPPGTTIGRGSLRWPRASRQGHGVDFTVRVLSCDGSLGFVEATLFVFPAAAAGATVVAADFGGGAAVGLLGWFCAFLCKFSEFWEAGGACSGGFGRDGGFGKHCRCVARLRPRLGQGVAEDEEGSAETSRGGGFGVVEDLVEDLECLGGAGDGFFVERYGPFRFRRRARAVWKAGEV